MSLPSLQLRVSLVLALTCLLAACGFQLRGTSGFASVPARVQTLVLDDTTTSNAFARSMRRALQDSGITLVDSGAYPRLVLGPEETGERTVSLDSTARAGEFSLRLSMSFTLEQGGNMLLGPELVVREAIYLADPQNAIAKNEEAELILSELRRGASMEIMGQLARLPE